jgi:general secretion pathway protein B
VSFILDALRKSDAERQRQGAPGLADIRYARRPVQRSTWVPILVVVLAANLLVMGWLWFRDSPPASGPAPAPSVATPPLPVAEPAPLPPPPEVRPLAEEAAAVPPAEPGSLPAGPDTLAGKPGPAKSRTPCWRPPRHPRSHGGPAATGRHVPDPR